MQSRILVYGLVVGAAAALIAVGADLMVETDEEVIGELADGLVAGSAAERLDEVLRLTDPSRVEVAVRADGRTERFGPDASDGDVVDAVQAALRPLGAGELEVVQRSVGVDGESARLALRVRADGEVHDLTLGLRRHGQGWLTQRIAVR